MVATIPNDIFQYSLFSAFQAPSSLHSGGPPTFFLTRHGTHGLGFFAPPSTTTPPDICALIDSTAYRISAKDGNAKRAEPEAQLPFVMVTVFEGVWRVKVEPQAAATTAEEGSVDKTTSNFNSKAFSEILLSGGGDRGGRNSYMPFRIVGTFSRVSCGPTDGQAERARQLTDVKGTMFGFYAPPWAEAVSGKGLQCVFLGKDADAGSERGLIGGLVLDFEAKGEVVVEHGVCGRFHLGLPSGEEWEGLELGSA